MRLGLPTPFLMTPVRNPHDDTVIPSHNQSLHAAQERERILEAVRGKTLDPYQAELVCAALAFLGEM